MTSSTIMASKPDTSSVSHANSMHAKLDDHKVGCKISTASIMLSSERTVSSTRIEGSALLRYAPKEPVISERSTQP